jgi:hypothetical protein
MRLRVLLTRSILLAVLAGASRCGPAAAPPPAPPPKPSVEDVAGSWSGTLRASPCELFASAGRCGAVNNVVFTLSQDGSQLTGRYICANGDTLCRHGGADDSGKVVAGSISNSSGLNLSVIVPADFSNCYYSGTTTAPNQASGVYMCYQGSIQVEEGVWNLTRTSSAEAE